MRKNIKTEESRLSNTRDFRDPVKTENQVVIRSSLDYCRELIDIVRRYGIDWSIITRIKSILDETCFRVRDCSDADKEYWSSIIKELQLSISNIITIYINSVHKN